MAGPLLAPAHLDTVEVPNLRMVPLPLALHAQQVLTRRLLEMLHAPIVPPIQLVVAGPLLAPVPLDTVEVPNLRMVPLPLALHAQQVLTS